MRSRPANAPTFPSEQVPARRRTRHASPPAFRVAFAPRPERARHANRVARQTRASPARAHSSSRNVLALALAACSQSRAVGNHLSAGSRGQRSCRQLHAWHRAAPFSLCFAGTPSRQIHRRLRRPHGHRLPTSAERPNSFPLPPSLRCRTTLAERKIFIVLVHPPHLLLATLPAYMPHLILLTETR